MGWGTRFRAVGHRNGSKQLLSTSVGLVLRLFATKTILRSSLEPGVEL
jgi:hypothetical protein